MLKMLETMLASKMAKAIYYNFTWFYEVNIINRYRETKKGKCEQERLYWMDRNNFMKRVSGGL